MSGAWSKGTNKAVATPPPPTSSLQSAAAAGSAGRTATGRSLGGRRDRDRDNTARGRGSGGNYRGGGSNSGGRGRGRSYNDVHVHAGGGGGRGGGQGYSGSSGRGGGGRGRGGDRSGDSFGRNSNNSNRRNVQNAGGRGRGRNNSHNNKRNLSKELMRDIQLLDAGAGKTPAQQSVKRISARVFMTVRMNFVDPLPDFKPHEQCHWKSEDRLEELESWSKRAIELGDVSKKQNPDNSRDTAPALEDCVPLAVNEETRWKPKSLQTGDDEQKTDETTEDIIAKALLILNKISWTTIDRLTTKFIEDTDIVENAEARKACIAMLIQKSQREHHFGPMYAKLCSNIIKQIKAFKKELLSQCQQEFETNTTQKIAQVTEGMTDPAEREYHATMVRKAYIGHIKFLGELYMLDVVKLSIMMHCLDELLKDETNEKNLECFAHLMTTMGHKLDHHASQNDKPFDWDSVRAVMKTGKVSKRIQFLFKDLFELKANGWVKRREEETAKSLEQIHNEIAEEEQGGKSGRRSSRRSVPQVADSDGFVAIPSKTTKKMHNKGNVASNLGSPPRAGKKTTTKPKGPSGASAPAAAVSVKSPEECASKTKSILREFFVGGDLDDAVLSVDELVQVKHDGALERGAKVIESGVLQVLEMKEENVTKMLDVLRRCISDNKIPADSIKKGLAKPFDALCDIEIDAPLARSHLVKVYAELMTIEKLQLDFLLEAPKFFISNGKPAAFACKVLKKLGRDPTGAEVAVVQSLMTNSDKETFSAATDMIAGTS